MLEAFGDTQQALLKLMLRHRDGLTVDALAESLRISRPAVRQHLSALERDGYIRGGELQRTGGRPGQGYVLSAKGLELFPRKYSWFSELLLEALRKERGDAGLGKWLAQLGETVARGILGEKTIAKGGAKSLEEIAQVMNDFGFDAEVAARKEEGPAIEARNCIYHHLAARYPEVCKFDIALLAELRGAKVRHEECMLRGGKVCRFRFQTAAAAKKK